jgi:hypothetical protein
MPRCPGEDKIPHKRLCQAPRLGLGSCLIRAANRHCCITSKECPYSRKYIAFKTTEIIYSFLMRLV